MYIPNKSTQIIVPRINTMADNDTTSFRHLPYKLREMIWKKLVFP